MAFHKSWGDARNSSLSPWISQFVGVLVNSQFVCRCAYFRAHPTCAPGWSSTSVPVAQGAGEGVLRQCDFTVLWGACVQSACGATCSGQALQVCMSSFSAECLFVWHVVNLPSQPRPPSSFTRPPSCLHDPTSSYFPPWHPWLWIVSFLRHSFPIIGLGPLVHVALFA